MRLPTVEEALFGRKNNNFLFHEDIEFTRQHLLPWIVHPQFSLEKLRQAAKTDILKYHPEKHIQLDEYEHVQPWIPIFKKTYKGLEYSYWITIWARINCCFHAEKEKLNLFINAHLECIRYLDHVKDPQDSLIDIDYLKGAYKKLGKSPFDNDRNFIQVEDFQKHQTRPYPLQVIRKHFPDLCWTPEEVSLTEFDKKAIRKDSKYYLKPEWEKEKGYMECLFIMKQIASCYAQTQNKELQDCLWFYHGAFLDYLCGDDPVLDWKTYPHDNRCFTGWDLPDMFHIMMSIPFWGEQVELTFPIGKFIQKSLPFAGARRQLVNRTDVSLTKDESFSRLFSKLFYCMLLDMYPHFLSCGTRIFDLKRLTRMRQIAGDRKILKEALARDLVAKEKDKGCYMVFTAFRLWILLMCHEQRHFLDYTPIDWNVFRQQTIEMANTIRNSDLFQQDCFADAREILSKVNKNAKTKVYRFRKSNTIDMILEKMTQTLEKEIYKRVEDQDHPNTEIKTKLLNLLTRIPKEEWLSSLSLSMMRVHGKVSEHTVFLVQRMIDVYYNSNGKPKEFEQVLSLFELRDFKVVCWYFQVISLLNKIDFDFITHQQVQDIDYALATKKYIMLPGEKAPSCVNDVFFTICCQVIKTLINSYDFYGHENIAYDLDRGQYICSKAHKKASTVYNDEEALAFSDFEKERKQMRDKRKDFNHIPCANNPVLCIPMRGYVLIYNKSTRYMHCPSCGSFHQFNWNGWQGSTYACPQCRYRQKKFYYTCHTCMLEIPEEVAKQCNTEVAELDGGDVRDVFRRVYFCRKHLPKDK